MKHYLLLPHIKFYVRGENYTTSLCNLSTLEAGGLLFAKLQVVGAVVEFPLTASFPAGAAHKTQHRRIYYTHTPHKHAKLVSVNHICGRNEYTRKNSLSPDGLKWLVSRNGVSETASSSACPRCECAPPSSSNATLNTCNICNPVCS